MILKTCKDKVNVVDFNVKQYTIYEVSNYNIKPKRLH